MADPGVNNLKPFYDVVEQVIIGLGAPIDQCRCVNQQGQIIPGQWSLVKGSANVYVDVYVPQGSESAYFCIASPVMQVVTPKLKEFYEKLLSLNHDMYGASFSISKGWVWCRILRECEGMDANECKASFDRVGYYADQYDDELKAEFGG